MESVVEGNIDFDDVGEWGRGHMTVSNFLYETVINKLGSIKWVVRGDGDQKREKGDIFLLLFNVSFVLVFVP